MAQDGAVSMPSLHDMAHCMIHVNAGGLRGLRFMGLLGAEANTLPEVEAALSRWMAIVERYFTHEQLSALGWDIFAAENALCKIGRLEQLIAAIEPTS